MKKIEKRILIVSGIKEINRKDIYIKELLGYIKNASNQLKLQGYDVERVTDDDVISFFRHCPFYGKCSEGTISIDNLEFSIRKFEKFFLNELDDKVKEILRKEVLYSIAIVKDENLIVYTFSSNNTIQDEIKKFALYDDKNESFLLDFSDLSKNLPDVSLNKFIKSDNILKKLTVNLNTISDYMNKLHSLTDPKYKNIVEEFGINNNITQIQDTYNYVKMYYDLAVKNSEFLNQNPNGYRYKILKRKI